jgi:uncharacterized protein YndB with AHSA1/START domain
MARPFALWPRGVSVPGNMSDMRSRRYIVKCTVEPVEVRQSATVDLPRPADEVWEFMWNPASSRHWSVSAELGTTVPGTPERQIGEVQAFIHRKPSGERFGSLLEVVDVELGRRAVTRDLSAGIEAGGTLTIEPRSDRGCRLTQEFWAHLPAGTPVSQVEQMHVEQASELQALTERLAVVLG